MIKPYPFEMMDDALFEMIDLISKWFAPSLFEMTGCISLRYDGWLSLRNADGRLFEMRTRDYLPSAYYLNDSHISCHLRMILLQKRSSFRNDNNRKSLSKLCHFKRIDDFYSFFNWFHKIKENHINWGEIEENQSSHPVIDMDLARCASFLL